MRPQVLRMTPNSVVIVGAGHAGVQAAASLREQGFDGEVVLLSAENSLPYQRPPLSKAFLKGEMEIHGLPLRADAHFRDQRIDLRLGVGATRIDRARQEVELTDGGASITGISSLRLARGNGGSMRQESICRACLRCATSPTRPRSASALAPSRRSSLSAPGSSGSKSPRPPRASGPRRPWSRSRARWAARSRRSCPTFS